MEKKKKSAVQVVKEIKRRTRGTFTSEEKIKSKYCMIWPVKYNRIYL